jgi:SSS family solute:Na+ symporter/sodium/pantothenate symporter
MINDSMSFGTESLLLLGVYLILMLGIGGLARSKRREESLNDFVLAGRSFGFFVLVMTLFATQYSGNTLVGFTAASYRQGLGFLVCVHFMTAIVVAYIFYAPVLYRLSREKGYITPGDYIYDRFGSDVLRLVVSLLMVYALCNFAVAQVKTLGVAFAGISQGRIPVWAGAVGLVVIMLIYESLGGMRSVAWTDAIQGIALMSGLVLLLVLTLNHISDFGGAIEKLAADPNTKIKIERPDFKGSLHWLSFILMVGLGGAIYPQAIQRIFSAQKPVALKRSLAVMAFLPFCTALIAVIVGVVMASHLPSLEAQSLIQNGKGLSSESVFSLICLEITRSSALGYWAVTVIFAALVAAVMSTTDSAFLSLGSIVAQDFYRPLVNPDASQSKLTGVGRKATWVLVIPITYFALAYKGTLVQLLQVKFELLIQCVPCFYLGIRWKGMTARGALAGIFTGLTTTLMLTFSGDLGITEVNHKLVWGIHAGIIGLFVNLMVCGSGLFRGTK